MGRATFSGNGNYVIDIDAAVARQNYDQNYSDIYYRVIVYKLAGTGYWRRDADSNGYCDSNVGRVWTSGGFAYDFRGVSEITFAQGEFRVYHNADGYANYEVYGGIFLAGGLGSANAGSGVKAAARIPKPPGAPVPVRVDQVTPTSMRYQFSGTTDGGSPITGWQAQIARDAAFTQGVQTVSSSGTTTFSNLQPATNHFMRSRGINGRGPGAWSVTTQQATLPSGPPGVTIAPSPLGSSATLTMTPPGSAAGVVGYRVEYRVQGQSAVTAVTTSTNSITVENLSPGTTYEWRAQARYSSADSPWSTWQARLQPTPSPSISGYFDGSLPPQGIRSFEWIGMPHASKSRAITATPTGWEASAPGGAIYGLGRVGAGIVGPHAARVSLESSLSTSGLSLGMGSATSQLAEVVAGAPYVGSMFVRPSRSQRLALYVDWLSATVAPLGTAIGQAVVVGASAVQRLEVAASAPEDAKYARLSVRDVTGAGWSPWLSGQYLDGDGMMVTLQSLYDYFDGNTTPSREYVYEWNGPEGASTSVRQPAPPSADTRLQDPDCVAAPLAPRPPVIETSCIDDSGTWRRYWVVVPETSVPEWRELVPAIRIITGSADARQVRVRAYENPDALPPAGFPGTEWISEQTISYIPPRTMMTLDSMSERASAFVDGDGPLPANHLLYGRDSGPATWPTFSCGYGYLLSFDVPLEAPVGAISFEVDVTVRM